MIDSQHRARKRFGQNFLHDPGIITRIVNAINPGPHDNLIEIGPGQGAITFPLLAICKKIQAVELDRDLIALLESNKPTDTELTIHSQDALKTDFCALAGDRPARIVGNLPYNISTPLLFHLLTQSNCIQDMHFMLQKEVVERMAATAGGNNYGRLSVMLQYHCDVEPLFTIGPGAFNPPPKVDSAFVRLIPHKQPPVTINSYDSFATLVKQAFAQRRKTLRNNLKPLLNDEQIVAAAIDPGIRAERLSLQDFARLANLL
jgi:16S rRNA (adenine1518-N6/adenine1519-N6)-dimethyltransferase